MSRLLYAILGVGAVIICTSLGLLAFSQKPQPAIPTAVVPTSIPAAITPTSTTQVIGTSVEGRAISVYSFGTGATHILFAGGMHGGYEWNSVLLAYQFIDYLTAHLDIIPPNLTVDIIPSINPDGVVKAIGKEGRFTLTDVVNTKLPVGTGRFNANKVDLNRNFGCNWQATSTWRSRVVSAGTAPFSEPEAAALRDFIIQTKPADVVFWHSQANAVYASECHDGVLPGTITLMKEYAKAANYKAVPSFNAYPITGDSEGWLASIGIPAITVELSTHNSTEWTKNLAGIKAVLNSYLRR